jgi:hypothetical protein
MNVTSGKFKEKETGVDKEKKSLIAFVDGLCHCD